MNIISQNSHATIELLNLDAQLETFNYQNFKFLTDTTPEIESLATAYNSINADVQKYRSGLTVLRQVLDGENALLWDEKTKILWRDRYQNGTAQ